MLVYGILNVASDEVQIYTISDNGLDDYMRFLGDKCYDVQFPFVYSLGTNELRWWCPADECYDDYDELYYLDDDGDEHYLKDECYISDGYYHKIIIKAYDDFTERLRGIIPYLR